ADDRDEIVLGEDGVVLRHVYLEPLIDFVAADPPQVVALGMEEQPLQRLARRLKIRRFARAQQRVDLRQRLRFRVRRILGERVLAQWRLAPARRHALKRSNTSSSPTRASGSPFLFSGSGTSAASSVPSTSRFCARPSSLPVMSISFTA